jgi:hypothetical protein
MPRREDYFTVPKEFSEGSDNQEFASKITKNLIYAVNQESVL